MRVVIRIRRPRLSAGVLCSCALIAAIPGIAFFTTPSARPPGPKRVFRLPATPAPPPVPLLPPMTEVIEIPRKSPAGFVFSSALPPPEIGPAPQPDVIRKVHPPNGSYDVVVIQSKASSSLPTDSPLPGAAAVFSVYFDIGLPKMCRLQYSSTDGAPLEAPYPSVTLVPGAIRSPREPILIHGFVTAAGRLRGLSILGSADRPNSLLELLQEWIFRPARHGDQSVELEVVLTI